MSLKILQAKLLLKRMWCALTGKRRPPRIVFLHDTVPLELRCRLGWDELLEQNDEAKELIGE